MIEYAIFAIGPIFLFGAVVVGIIVLVGNLRKATGPKTFIGTLLVLFALIFYGVVMFLPGIGGPVLRLFVDWIATLLAPFYS